MKTTITIFVIILLITSFSRCEKERHACATCSENITWHSYGEWTLQKEGMNGSSEGFNSINIISDCGWGVLMDTAVSGLHEYAAQSCNLGVIFYWFGQRFTVFMVMNGWEGSTDKRIKIGDDMTKFIKAYSYFKPFVYKPPAPRPDTSYIYLEYYDQTEGNFVGAVFTKDNRLFQLYVQLSSWGSSKGSEEESLGSFISKDGKLVPWYLNNHLHH